MIRARLANLLLFLVLVGHALSGATAPTIATQPASQTVTLGAKATFSVAASGTAPLSYQWSRNGSAISGATSASYTTAATVAADSGAKFTVKVSNSAGTKTSNAATLTLNLPPSITAQPANQSVATGSAATFSVTATGTGTLTYQWLRNGTQISGATSATYTTLATVAGDSGASFTVKVSNSYGNVTSSAATLTVTAPVAPSITTQPASRTVTLGSTAAFTVAASGTAPLTYQWFKNGASISGATSASYTTPATVVADNGAAFTVKVINAGGAATSNAATLTLNLPPTISTQPANQSVVVGGAATFSVVASGTGTLTYQWSKKGTLITGATSASYTTPPTVIGDNTATFTVKVTNSYGTVTSSAATLTVTAVPAPTITSFTPVSGVAGTTVTLTGTNFTGATAVKFNGTNASSFAVGSPTSITAVAPTGVASGKISVTTVGGTTTSTGTFTVAAAPAITSFTPTSGIAGTSITITGANFTGATAVKFNGTDASSFAVGSSTSITAVAPTGAISGTISVTTLGGTAVSSGSFTVFDPADLGKVLLTPTQASVIGGGIASFTASVVGSTQGVTWRVEAGSWSYNKTTCTYTAAYRGTPLPEGVYTLTATSIEYPAQSAIAPITVRPFIILHPDPAAVPVGESLQFAADVYGQTNPVLNWSAENGTIDQNGHYIAPATLGTDTVSAALASDTEKTASISVRVHDDPSIITFTGTPTSITAGEFVTLVWDVRNSTSVSLSSDPNMGGLGAVAPSGSLSLKVNATTTFTLSAANATATTRKTVEIKAVCPTVLQFKAESNLLSPGQATRLYVEFANGTGRIEPEVGGVQNGTWVEVQPARTTQYTLVVTNPYGVEKRASLTIGLITQGAFTPIGQPSEIPSGLDSFSAAPLADGRLWITGGRDHNDFLGSSASTFFWDPVTFAFSPGPQLRVGRESHTTTLLPDGRVIVSGGWSLDQAHNSADIWLDGDIFNPVNQKMGNADSTYATSQAATLLPSGMVLYTGGIFYDYPNSRVRFTDQACLYDPIYGSCDRVGSMTRVRAYHQSLLLPNGKVLIVERDGFSTTPVMELFDPQSIAFVAVGEASGEALLMADGRVLIMGKNGTFVFDPSTNLTHQLPDSVGPTLEWYQVPSVVDGLTSQPMLPQPILLPDGRVLRSGLGPLPIFDPRVGDWRALADGFNPEARGFIYPMNDGRVRVLRTWGTLHIFDPHCPLTVNAGSAIVQAGRAFTLTVTGADTSGLQWTCDQTGAAVSSGGVFKADHEGLYRVNATNAKGDKGGVWITVVPPIAVYISDHSDSINVLTHTDISAPFLNTGQQKQFYATVQRSQQVTWSLEEGDVAGTITADGLYTAPAVPGGPYHVIARSVEDPTRFERVAITVMTPITVTPSSATLDPLESQPYSANDDSYWTIDSPNTVNSVGTVVAGTRSGTYTVTARSEKYRGRSGTAILSVNSKPLVMVPRLLTLLAGGTIQFNAYSNGSQLNRDTMNWSTNGGTIDWNAIYVAPLTPGTYTVTVSSKTDATLTTQATVIVPQASQGSISLRETSVSMNPAEGYLFRAYIQGGSPDAVQWQATSGIIGTRAQGINPDGSAWVDALYISPYDQGTFRVRANLGFQQADATVMVGVAPHLDSFTASPTTIRPGGSVTLSWSASDFSTLTLNPGNVDVTAKQSLQIYPSQDTLYTLTAQNPGKTASLSTWVRMAGVVTSVGVSPGSANLNLGAQVSLAASIQGTGSFDPSLVWTASGGTVTAVASGGATYTAPMMPGIYTVTATSVADPSKSASTTVTVVVPFGISPSSATLFEGMQMSFMATPQVPNGENPGCNWTTNGGTLIPVGNGGNANYTAPMTPGQYFVTVTKTSDSSKTATAIVTVQPSQVTMNISPKDATLNPGQGTTFGASIQVTGSNNSNLTWTCTGGTIIQKGHFAFYAAPLAPGTYVVTATSIANPDVSVSASITVVASGLSSGYLNLLPSEATLCAGQRLFLGTNFMVQDPTTGLDWTATLGEIQVEMTGASGVFTASSGPGAASVTVKGRTHTDLGRTIALTVNAASSQFATVPSSARVGTGQSLLVEAVDAQGNSVPNPSWVIQESGGGIISGAGQYCAPLQAGTYHIKATHPTDASQIATSTITVVSGGDGGGNGPGPTPTDEGVTVSPDTTQIPAGTVQSFSALVKGLDDQSVTWAVENSPAAATIDSQGVFSANQAGIYRVFATSVADPTKNGSSVLTVVSSVSLIAGAPNMDALRGYSVTALKDGKVLIAGGQIGDTFTGAARVFDPVTKAFTDLPSMLIPRSYHLATLLNDGRVLLAGGVGDAHSGSATVYGDVVAAEVFNPVSKQFEALPQPTTGGSFSCPGLMRRPHWMPSSAVLGNGQVLVAGNEFRRTQMVFPTPLPFVEVRRYLLTDLFDPNSNIFDVSNWDAGANDWALTTNCFEARARSAMVTMDDGSALITGGATLPVASSPTGNYQGSIFNEAWRFTPSEGRTVLSSMVKPREGHTMTKLPDGKVLIVGGSTSMTFQVNPPAPDYDPQEHYLSTATAEIYDPTTGVFTATGSMSVPRWGHAAILLPTGKVMIVGGKTENGDGSFSWPTTAEMYDPETGVMSVMDHLDYGLSDPKLALLPDGSVFVAGQVQAPMEPPAQQSQSNGLKMMTAADLAGNTLTSGSTLMGVISSSWNVIACPEEASLKYDKVAKVLAPEIGNTWHEGLIPKKATISVPMAGGVNEENRYFILKIKKPSPNYSITGFAVTLKAGNQNQVVNGPISADYSQLFSRSDVTYYHGLPAPPGDPTDEAEREYLRKQWLQAWLPASTPSDHVTEFYKVRVTMKTNAPSAIQYGVNGQLPPSDTLNYEFKIYYTLNGVSGQPFTLPPWNVPTIIQAHWDASQLFQGQSYGTRNNDQWCDLSTFSWVSDPAKRGLLEPVNDISLEHGRNTGHSYSHLDGRQADMYHPAYTTFIGSVSNTSGTQFRDTQLIPTLQRARGWVERDANYQPIRTVPSDPDAVRKLAQWIRNARVKIRDFMTVDTVGPFGLNSFIYMSTAGDGYPQFVAEAQQLRDLMLTGACVSLSAPWTDGTTSGSIWYSDLNLTNNPAIQPESDRPQPWGVDDKQWIGDTTPQGVHTNHLHLQWGTKSKKFLN